MSETKARGDEPIDKPLDKTVGFIGTGNMAEAMIKGLLAA